VTVVEFSTCEMLATTDQAASFQAVFLWAAVGLLTAVLTLLSLRGRR